VSLLPDEAADAGVRESHTRGAVPEPSAAAAVAAAIARAAARRAGDRLEIMDRGGLDEIVSVRRISFA
jgi:hypothetical protein